MRRRLTIGSGLYAAALMVVLAVGVGGCGDTGGSGRSGWFWQNPLPQGDTLSGVSFVDANTGTAVGGGGTILRTTDGGG